MRSNYWSCTKFADWIRGNPKMYAASLDEWDDWRAVAKAAHPIRYWIAEELLDDIQNVIHWPTDKIYSFKYWINNRFVTKTHALTSNLEKGRWHEFEERLLHCMFDELVNFIEVEQAWWNIAWDPEARKKYRAPFHAWGWFRWRTWRCPEAGLDALEWASKLTNEEFLDDDKKHEAEPTHQAIAAKEMLELYDWWKNRRPQRIEPMEASGWSAICEERRAAKMGLNELLRDKDEDRSKRSKAALDLCTEIEEGYYKEDEEMMIRLIKIRRSLWT